MPDIFSELRRFYKDYDKFKNDGQSDDELDRYHRRMLDCDAIRTVLDASGNLLGYVEYWRINFEQFGRLICKAGFNVHEEDIVSGPICYLSNTCIHPEHRRGPVYKTLRTMFFEKNFGAEYFVGEALRKKHQPVKVFKRTDFIKKYLKEVQHG